MRKANLRDKIGYLNSLRGVAVLMVIFTHAGLYVKSALLGDGVRSVIADASRGVQLFYILSAFTLFYSLHMRSGEDKSRWTDFFIRRLFRIAPLWWVSLGAYLLLRNEFHFSWKNIVCNIFFVHGFHPQYINSIVVGGWSIAVEMNFYLLIPLFYKLCSNSSKTIIWMFWIYLASNLFCLWLGTWQVGYSEQVWKEFVFFFLPHQLPVFFFGFLLFHMVIRKDTQLTPSAWIHATLFILLIFSFHKDWFVSQCALLLPLVWIVSKAPQVPLWNNKVLQYLGKISFSLYLVHFAAVLIVRKSDILAMIPYPTVQFLVGFGFVSIVATGLASLTFHFVEKPGIRLGNRLIEFLESRKSLVSELAK